MDIRNEIQLDFTPENVRKVLTWGANPKESPHGYQAIANWCERFWNKYCDNDAPKEIERLMPVLADVEAQWDIFMASYTEQHPHAVKTAPSLPSEWFVEWLAELNA